MDIEKSLFVLIKPILMHSKSRQVLKLFSKILLLTSNFFKCYLYALNIIKTRIIFFIGSNYIHIHYLFKKSINSNN